MGLGGPQKRYHWCRNRKLMLKKICIITTHKCWVSQHSAVRWLGHSTHLGARKAGLPLPECGLEQFLSLCLDFLNQETNSHPGSCVAEWPGWEGNSFSVDTLVPLERGFTNMYFSLNNERNKVYYGMHHYINKLQLRVVRMQTTFGRPPRPSACPRA